MSPSDPVRFTPHPDLLSAMRDDDVTDWPVDPAHGVVIPTWPCPRCQALVPEWFMGLAPDNEEVCRDCLQDEREQYL